MTKPEAKPEAKIEPKIEAKIEPRTNVLPTVVFLALDVADKGQATVLAVLQDARAELRSALDQGLDLAEKVTSNAFRFAKQVVSRVDDASAEILASTERIVVASLASARESTRTAAALAVAPAA